MLFAANTTCRAREDSASAACATQGELFSHGSTFITGGTCASHANVVHTYTFGASPYACAVTQSRQCLSVNTTTCEIFSLGCILTPMALCCRWRLLGY